MVVCFSHKGGVGTTVVAGSLAVAVAERTGGGRGVLLVDLAGDQPVLFGLSSGPRRGVADWLAAGPGVAADALGRLEEEVRPAVSLLARGTGPLAGGRADALAAALAADPRLVVVDAGRAERCPVAAAVAAAANRRLLVTRACPLAVRPMGRIVPTGVVVVRDVGRALPAEGLGASEGGPVVAELAVDPAVGRAIDVGLASARLPRGFAAVLRSTAGRR